MVGPGNGTVAKAAHGLGWGWVLLVAILLLGAGASYALSNIFKGDARNTWEAEASQAQQWLSGTLLGWLEESYSPLSGVAILLENSETVTEDEFFSAIDSIEARATAVFLDAMAILVQDATDDDRGWDILFSTDVAGPLADDGALAQAEEVLQAVALARERPGQTLLGQPITTPDGRRFSPVALVVSGPARDFGIVGLLDYDAIVEGLFVIHRLQGVGLAIDGRFPTATGPGRSMRVLERQFSDILFESTTRTASAGADLSLTWQFGQEFSGGPDDDLARFGFWSVLAATLTLALLAWFLLNRNRAISLRVEEATAALESSTARFKVLFDESSDPYLIFDGGHFVDCNRAAVNLLGFADKAELLSQPPAALSPQFQPDGERSVDKAETVTAAAQTDGANRFDWIHLKKDGEEVPVEVALTSMELDGHPVLLVVWHDLTERYAAAQALRESEERYALVVRGSTDGVFDWNFPTGEIYFSPRYREILGLEEDEMPRQLEEWKARIHPDDLSKTLAARIDELLLSETDNYENEFRMRHKDGSWRWIRGRATIVRDEQGNLVRIAGAHTDITERKQHLQKIEQSERRLRQLLDMLPLPVATAAVDENARIEFLNKNFIDVFGWTLADVPDMEAWWAAAFPDPDSRSETRAKWETGLQTAAMENRSADPIETRATCKDGLIRIVEWRGAILGDSVIAVASDITDLRQQQEALESSEKDLRQVLDILPMPVAVVNAGEAMVIEYLNQTFVALFGWTLEDTPDMNAFTRCAYPDPLYRKTSIAEWDRRIEVSVRENRGIEPMEMTVHCKNGGDKIVEWRAASVGGKIVTVAADLTERKQMESALIAAKDSAEQASRAKSTFLANMSHELRTPMNAIIGYSEMLTEEAEEQGQEDFVPDLKKIHQAGSHLLGLINDILDLSKVEAGKMEAYAEDVDVDRLVDEVAGTAQPLMESNDNHLEVVREGPLGMARQDLTKIRQSLLNLLSNAAKFTHNGTVTLHVRREQTGDGDWLVFAISDTGIGIAADKMGAVFEEFGQADDSTTRNYGGTGLGLPISRRFTEMLGGELTVASAIGEGSTFTMRLPAIFPGAADAVATLKPQRAVITEPAKGERGADETIAVGRGIVLIIDDDPAARDIIGRTLSADGFEVRTAENGVEGLEMARELRPNVITLDVMMPDMDGWAVLRVLKADPGLCEIPVVMLTIVDDKSRGFSLGAADYLTKPVDREQLHITLERFLPQDESRPPVLVVEDDEAARAHIVHTVTEAGCNALQATNGREALACLGQSEPGLILLDLMMPVMDGFEFLIALRANPKWRSLPVVVLTAKDLDDDDRQMLNGRVEQIIEKGDQSHDEVLASVRRLLS